MPSAKILRTSSLGTRTQIQNAGAHAGPDRRSMLPFRKLPVWTLTLALPPGGLPGGQMTIAVLAQHGAGQL